MSERTSQARICRWALNKKLARNEHRSAMKNIEKKGAALRFFH